jgi:hypothetical protein
MPRDNACFVSGGAGSSRIVTMAATMTTTLGGRDQELHRLGASRVTTASLTVFVLCFAGVEAWCGGVNSTSVASTDVQRLTDPRRQRCGLH